MQKLPSPLEEYFQGVRNRLDGAYSNFKAVLDNEYTLLHSFLSSLPLHSQPVPLPHTNLTTGAEDSSSTGRWKKLAVRQENILSSLGSIEQRVDKLPKGNKLIAPNPRIKEKVLNIKPNQDNERVKKLQKRQETIIDNLKTLIDRASKMIATDSLVSASLWKSATDVTHATAVTTASSAPEKVQVNEKKPQQQPAKEVKVDNVILYYSLLGQATPSQEGSEVKVIKEPLATQKANEQPKQESLNSSSSTLSSNSKVATVSSNFNAAHYYSVLSSLSTPVNLTPQPSTKKPIENSTQRWTTLAARQEALLKSLETIQKGIVRLEQTRQSQIQTQPTGREQEEKNFEKNVASKSIACPPTIKVFTKKETTVPLVDNAILYYYALSNPNVVQTQKIAETTKSSQAEVMVSNKLLLSAEEREEVENEFVIIPKPNKIEETPQDSESKATLSAELHSETIQKTPGENIEMIPPRDVLPTQKSEIQKLEETEIQQQPEVAKTKLSSAPGSPQIERSPGEGQSKNAKKRRNRRKAQNEEKTFRYFPGGKQALVARRLPELRATEEPLPSREYKRMMAEREAAREAHRQVEEKETPNPETELQDDTTAIAPEIALPPKASVAKGFNPLAGLADVGALKTSLKKVGKPPGSAPLSSLIPSDFDPGALRAGLRKATPKVAEAPKIVSDSPPKLKPSEFKRAKSCAASINEIVPLSTPGSPPKPRTTAPRGGVPMGGGMDIASLRGALKKTASRGGLPILRMDITNQ